MKKILIIMSITILILLVACSISYNEYKNEYEQKNLINYDGKYNPKYDKDEINIILATDIHILAESLITDGETFDKFEQTSNGVEIRYSEFLFDALVKEVIEEQPDFFIITGDLTVNGELDSHKVLADKLTIIEDSGIEVLVIPGNHDINNPWAREFSENEQLKTNYVTPDEFKKIYENFGYSHDYIQSPDSLSYIVEVNDYLSFAMLDSNKYNSNVSIGSPMNGGAITKSTFNWYEDYLKQNKDKNVITFMHHNTMIHNDLFYDGYVIKNSIQFRELLNEYNQKYVFSGHMHNQHIQTDDNIVEILTEAYVLAPNKYAKIKITPTNLNYETDTVNIEQYASDIGSTNDDLLNYYTYYDLFNKEVNSNMIELFMENLNISYDDADKLLATFLEINYLFFSGADISAYENIDLQLTFKEMGRLGHYIESILEGSVADFNKFNGPFYYYD